MEPLLVLIALAIVASGPIALGLVLNLRKRLQDAERRVASLQTDLAIARRLPAAPLPGAAPEAESVEEAKPAPAAAESLPEPEPAAAPALEPTASGWSAQDIGWPTAETARPPARSLEERLGARWTVWVGGVALALGGLLLVRYSIEQGYFGPTARCILGLLFGIALAAGGEFLRRREKGGAATQTPAILTAAGTVAAFGAVYAAYGLYELIGPALAFVTLGAIAVAAIIAAALHGPMLAGVGLIGACAAPALVSTAEPNPWPVVPYLAIATGAAYVLARIRRWLWLACAAAAGAGLWAILFAFQDTTNFYHAALVQAVLSAAIAAAFLALLPHLATSDEDARFDPVATIVVGAFAAIACVVVLSGVTVGRFDLVTMVIAGLLTAGLAAAGAIVAPAAALVAVAGAFACAILWIWTGDLSKPVALSTVAVLHEPIEPTRFAIFAAGAALVVGFFGARRLATGRGLVGLLAGCYAAAASITPLAIASIAWLRLARADENLPFALIAGLLAAAFVLLAHYFRRGEPADAPFAQRLALGVFATAALGALALGFVFAFDKGVLTVALAASALAAAYVSARLDIVALRYAVAAMGFVVLARLAWEPRIIGASLGTTPVLNWLLFGYGVPALAFGLAARRLRLSGGEDLPARVAQSLCILFAALLTFFEIRHALNGGDLFARESKLIEQGLYATSAIAFSIVLTRLDILRSAPVFRAASYIAAGAGALVAIAGLGGFANPYFSCDPIEGGRVFNALLLGYGLPAILTAVLMRVARGNRPPWFVTGAGAASIVLLFLYACLQTRRSFHDANVCWSQPNGDVEIWAYSAVWLALGALLLLYGIFRQSRGARLASALFVLAATLKVFLYDLAGLEGVMRALSFIGLGLILIGIGLVYQKLVFRRAPPAGQAPPADPVL
jgi:uncharacterized membrane protein